MAEILLNFNKKNYYSNFGWCKTVKRLQENIFSKYLPKMGHILAKNMKGWSVKHEILCAEQSDRAEKKRKKLNF